MRKLSFLIPLFLMLASCGGTRQTADAVGEALQVDKEQVWQLVAVRGKEVTAKDAAATLMFYPEGAALRGRVACNRYFGDYSMKLDKVTADGTRYTLTTSDVSGNDVQCPEADMATQERYLALLRKSDACLLTAYSLTLYQRGKEILRYELQ